MRGCLSLVGGHDKIFGMRSAIVLPGLFLFGVSLAVAQDQANSLTPQEGSEGWKLLFDGRTMVGWEVHQAKN